MGTVRVAQLNLQLQRGSLPADPNSWHIRYSCFGPGSALLRAHGSSVHRYSWHGRGISGIACRLPTLALLAESDPSSVAPLFPVPSHQIRNGPMMIVDTSRRTGRGRPRIMQSAKADYLMTKARYLFSKAHLFLVESAKF